MTVELQAQQPAYNQLPANFAILLNNFTAISLTGEEKSKYLQGQVTCDVIAMDKNQLLNGAHCNAKGKTLSAFRLINHLDSHLLMQAKASVELSLKELKKFGVFAKVDITTADNLGFAAFVGEQAQTLLKQKFQQIPDSLNKVVAIDNVSIVYLAGQLPRYLVVAESAEIDALLTESKLTVFNDSVWDLLEITEGFPVLSSTTVEEYVPQMLNLQAIHGISFTKGCYLGQETVARMQYLGKNKRALFALSGTTTVAAPAALELKMGENWRKAGDILNIYQSDDNITYIQAVLANDLTDDAILRVKDDPNSNLSLISLPYSLT